MVYRSTAHLVPTRNLLEPKPEPDKYWREKAICKEQQSIFLVDFTQKQIAEQRRNEKKAQAICMSCPVRLHCLWDSLEAYDKYYIFGGATPEQRKEMRKMLKLPVERVA